jgi:ankyrin repeat protein
MKLIDDNIDTININYQFNMRTSVFSALNANMFKLFKKIISMDSFDSTVTDGFGETLLQSFMYVYSADDIVTTDESNNMLVQIISTIIDNKKIDLNACSISGDTALTTGAMYPKMAWIIKKLVSHKEVNVNMANLMGLTPLKICIEANNIEAIKELGKRPDLVVNKEDFKAAKKEGINLEDYIKPEYAFSANEIDSMESLISELEKAASVATE